MMIEIKEKLDDIQPFLPEVKAGADTAKEELGFLPEAAYDELAAAGKLWVVTAKVGGVAVYAGHLVFGGIYPHAKVFQLFVAAAFRGQGLARQLVEFLVERLTSGHWLSIKASVAADLAANAAWARLGFRTVRTKPGGLARKRQINVRVRELDTPSLFRNASALKRHEGLRLAERFPQRPIYLIDLNVLFDTVRKRTRSTAAAKVIRAGMSHSIRLMVAAEFREELLRTSKDQNNDPLLSFASQLACLRRPQAQRLKSLTAELAPAIFPERWRQGLLTERDRSDLIHVATAIDHEAAGFITSEKAILRARAHLHDTWNLDVVGVEEFARLVDPGVRAPRASAADFANGTLSTRRNYEEDLELARSFLWAMSASAAFVHEALACHGTDAQWLLALDGTQPIGFAKWDVHSGSKRTADVHLCIDESHPAAEIVLEHALDLVPREASLIGPTLVRLSILPGHTLTKQTALSAGFSPPYGASEHSKIQRLTVGAVLLEENWRSARQSLTSVASVRFPLNMPTYANARELLTFNVGEQTVEMSLVEAERILSPVLLLFPGRDGAIVPIEEQFARELIGASPQMSLLTPPEVILRRERVYVSAPKTRALLSPGKPILFYESRNSGGRGCVTAIARITESRIVSKADALGKVRQRGVLDVHTLEMRSVGQYVTETTFDNMFLFQTPVPLKRLRELGCVDGSNLVSARPISHDKLVQVVREGRVGG